MSTFTPLSEDQIMEFSETAEKIAEQVAKNSLECTANRNNIVGPYASYGEQKHGLYINKGSREALVAELNKSSYIFNGLDSNKIRIEGKVNNILIRDCRYCQFDIPDGAISGVTILKGNHVVVNLPLQNTTALEQTYDTVISGEVTADTVIYVTASMDIIINGENLRIHPFVQGVFTNGRFHPTRYVPPELQLIV